MANDEIRRIIEGAIAGGTGSLQGSMLAQQEKERQRQAKNKMIRSLLLGDSQLATQELKREELQAKLDQPPPEPKPMTKTQIEAREIEKAIETGDWSIVRQIQTIGKVPKAPTTKKDPTIGPISAGSLLKGREKTVDKAQEQFLENLNVFGPAEKEFPPGTPIEQALSSIFSGIPETVTEGRFNPFVENVDVPNPELEALFQKLEQLGGVPQEFEPGDLKALQDSIAQAQGTQGIGSGDIDIATALRDFVPETKSIRDVVGGKKAKKKSKVDKATRKKLKAKGFSDEEIEEALSQLP